MDNVRVNVRTVADDDGIIMGSLDREKACPVQSYVKIIFTVFLNFNSIVQLSLHRLIKTIWQNQILSYLLHNNLTVHNSLLVREKHYRMKPSPYINRTWTPGPFSVPKTVENFKRPSLYELIWHQKRNVDRAKTFLYNRFAEVLQELKETLT